MIKVQFDPCNHFQASSAELAYSCAWPLEWALEWFADPIGDLSTYLRDRYGFGELHRFSPATKLNAAGCMTYPGDPPAPPMVVVKGHGSMFMQFQHGIVHIVTPTDAFFARMD